MKKRLPTQSDARRLAVALALCAALLLCLCQTSLAHGGSLSRAYTPEDCAAWSHHKTRLNYLDYPGGRKASDEFLFCGIDWDTDLDTALRTIAANTNRSMEDAGNGTYMGVSYGSPFWGLSDDECFLTLITVTPEDFGWWVECQLTPEQVEFADEWEAAAWFSRVWQALDALKHSPPSFILELDGQAYSLQDAEMLIDLWREAVSDGCESVYAFIDFNNVTLSLEKDFYGDAYYTTCWLTLGPSVS